MTRRVAVVCAFAASILGMAVVAGASSGLVPDKALIEHWDGRAWTKAANPSPSDGGVLNGVDAITDTNVWTVGQHGDGPDAHPLIEHWDGSEWSIVPGGSTPDGSWLDDVAAVTPTDVWAVGHGAFGDAGQPIIEHWDGAHWILVADPDVPGGELFGVTKVSATNVWAVGTVGGKTSLVEHWNGASWKVVPSPSSGEPTVLRDVAARTGGDIWAVGFTQPMGSAGHAVAEHWNGTNWSLVPPNSGNGSGLTSVTYGPGSGFFAAGSFVNGEGCLRTLVQHWTGSEWEHMSTPNPFACDNELFGIGANSSGVQAVGDRPQGCPGDACQDVTLAIGLTAGAWKVQHSANTTKAVNQLYAVDRVPSSPKAWAVGLATASFG